MFFLSNLLAYLCLLLNSCWGHSLVFLSTLWWKCDCRSILFSLSSKSPPFTLRIPGVSSIQFKSVFELILLQAVIQRFLTFPEKSLWSESITTLSSPRPDDALTDIIANSTLGITKFYVAVNTVSCTLVSTGVIAISTSPRTLLTMFFSIVCISKCGSLIWVGFFVLFKKLSPSTAIALLSFWTSWLLCPTMKSASGLRNWLRSFSFRSSFGVKTILKTTLELTNINNQFIRKEQKINVDRDDNNKSVSNVLEAICNRCLYFLNDFPSLGQLSVVSSPLTFSTAFNLNTSLHEVTNATVFATKTIKSIREK